MSIVNTSSFFFVPILGLLLVVLVLVVLVTIIALAARNDDGRPRVTGPVTYFLLGVSLVTLGIGVSTAGIVTHSVSELVGPASYDLTASDISGCSSSSSNLGSSSSSDVTIPVTIPQGDLNGSTLCSDGAGSAGLISGSGNNDNHYISSAVAAGLFGLAALAGFLLVWRRVLHMVREKGIGVPPVGRLPLNYAYLVAGLAALSLLVFIPAGADSIFRAIAPGVNETAGHAEGVRNLI
ncbi:MAG TPA: hypothetical protein VFV02_11870, partial [Acidimicrobiales bacterium]|nr:hypothetical protein [Acidimicrobiales bacterium]